MSNPLGLPDSDLQLYDRPSCLITGGTSGIGLATAQKFALQGYNIVTCGRDQQRLNQAKEQISASSKEPMLCLTHVADLSVDGTATQLATDAIQQLGKIDILINNAGLAPLAPLEEVSDDVFEKTLNVNVRSSFYLTRAVWKQMKQQGGGVVVNISSLAAVDPFPGFSLYGASKAWADLMTTALAAEGTDSKIRVYSIRPGAVETPMLRGLFPDFPAEQCVGPEDVADKIWQCVDQPDDHSSGDHFVVMKQPTQ